MKPELDDQFEVLPYSVMNSPKVDSEIRDIFFISSSRTIFSSGSERMAFFDRWTSAYFEKYQNFIWLARKDEAVIGYILGCPNSLDLIQHFSDKIPSYLVFRDQFETYSAHLHMNTAPKWRGHGVGKRLLRELKSQFKENKCSGLHLVTSPGESNVNFYRKNAFTFEIQRSFKTYELLFMGQSL